MNRSTSLAIIELVHKKLQKYSVSSIEVNLGELSHQTISSLKKTFNVEKLPFGYWKFSKLPDKKVTGLQAIE